MAMATSTNPDSNAGSDAPRRGRYRFCAGQSVDPNEGLHPEMLAEDAAALQRSSDPSVTSANEVVPSSPAELIAMQNDANKPRPEKPERTPSANVTQVMELIDKLDTKAAEVLEIAFSLVRRLEGFHDAVVDEMRKDDDASHNQMIAWAIDADRLMQARILLGHVDLE
jgi:hypothetical protein